LDTSSRPNRTRVSIMADRNDYKNTTVKIRSNSN
jgi:hypothetical protein